MNRINGYGQIDRTREIRFRFDGVQYSGHPGDTLASALLANGTRIFGRSFKYHRPRGVLTAGSEEPNALVTLQRGEVLEPNIRATTQEIYEGLCARGQNGFPSIRRDIMGLNDVVSAFLGAGFYYKTFMWPRSFWEKLYEPLIRRAAGLGKLSGKADDEHYESAFAHCDLLIIGAGPAGIMAALTAVKSGARIILADENSEPGGQVLASQDEIGGMAAFRWAANQLEQLKRHPNFRYMKRTTIMGCYDAGQFSAYERLGEHLTQPPITQPPKQLARGTYWRIRARRAILASGATERPLVFPNNDRPGIMMASAIQHYLHRYGVVPGQNISFFINNNEALRVAEDVQRAGIHIAAVIDGRIDGPEPSGLPLWRGWKIVNTEGRGGLEAITIERDGRQEKIYTDCLGLSGGWNPNLHLTCHLGAKPEWNPAIHAFTSKTDDTSDLDLAGSVAGLFSTKTALESGQQAGLDALRALSIPEEKERPALPEAEDRPYVMEPLWEVKGRSRAWVDFQNDVTSKDIRLAAQENYRSVEHMKRYTTQGMAPDQGKNSNVNAIAILADATSRSIPETGTTTFRPPYSPMPLGAIGAHGRGKSFAPERKTTSDAWARSKGAPMIEAGLWFRPSYFPQVGETHWRQSCDREVNFVRQHVGVADVSTLGKISVQGPDSAAFLDFVYTNMISTLKIGRVRYGLMLREDGHVMDDGTAARFGETSFLISTTTAAAGQVMSHLEYVHQALVPEMDVSLISETEQWAQFAIAGPKARSLLSSLIGAAFDPEAWPFMGCGTIQLGSITGRLFRISFSGELGYELAVPARYGADLFSKLVIAAETLGGGAYGMEALNVLRIEKGFITHSEIDGRVTAFDLGMEKMISTKKSCIGKIMASRPGLNASLERTQLVGLEPVDGKSEILSGARLFNEDSEAIRIHDIGYVSSHCYSPTLEKPIALGFLLNGRTKYGQTIRLVDHLRDVDILVRVTSPVFYDPEGKRLRA